MAINEKTGMPPFGILANHKIKICFNEKNNDTIDYSEQLEFLNSEPYYASKKIVNQSSNFPVRCTGSYRHKKALLKRDIFEWHTDLVVTETDAEEILVLMHNVSQQIHPSVVF